MKPLTTAQAASQAITLEVGKLFNTTRQDFIDNFAKTDEYDAFFALGNYMQVSGAQHNKPIPNVTSLSVFYFTHERNAKDHNLIGEVSHSVWVTEEFDRIYDPDMAEMLGNVKKSLEEATLSLVKHNYLAAEFIQRSCFLAVARQLLELGVLDVKYFKEDENEIKIILGFKHDQEKQMSDALYDLTGVQDQRCESTFVYYK